MKTQWTLQDLNLRPLDYEPRALTTELKVLFNQRNVLLCCNKSVVRIIVRLSARTTQFILTNKTTPLVKSYSLYRVRTDDFFLVREALSQLS